VILSLFPFFPKWLVGALTGLGFVVVDCPPVRFPPLQGSKSRVGFGGASPPEPKSRVGFFLARTPCLARSTLS